MNPPKQQRRPKEAQAPATPPTKVQRWLVISDTWAHGWPLPWGSIVSFASSGKKDAATLAGLLAAGRIVECTVEVHRAFAAGMRGLLTAREKEVVEAVGHKFLDKEIADGLSISTRTVNKHMQSILSKTHRHNRHDAFLFLSAWLPELRTHIDPLSGTRRPCDAIGSKISL